MRGIPAITNINPDFFTDGAKRGDKGGPQQHDTVLTMCGVCVCVGVYNVKEVFFAASSSLTTEDPLGFLEGFSFCQRAGSPQRDANAGEHLLTTQCTEGI